MTKKDCQVMINRINRANGIHDPKYNTIGALTLDCSYGGYKVAQIINAGGGQTDLSNRGNISETYYFLLGYETALRSVRNT